MNRSDPGLDGGTRLRDIYWVPLDGPGREHARLVIDYPETFQRPWPT